ncbi:TasA family protein [Cytobacillus sp. IB215316]|uniref:TasA family protein n=1 Tax=Cytobacillus sp. IB215316 TaxID=3097354 RepID=UPI002A146B5C|nr:TasA family protein [Cytobacillus sp. IB215316]MDX8362375.1 TasA family protein [Cytobacillus sp. IB215316]
MGIKKKLGLGMASAALGLSLIGGGTFAYFSDNVTVSNTFAAGTLDLYVDKEVVFEVGDIKPGDWMEREFNIKNDGNLDIEEVLMHTTISGDTDLASHLNIKILSSDNQVILENVTLAELASRTAGDNSPDITTIRSSKEKLPVGDEDTIKIHIEFLDNGQDQNHLQGAEISVGFDLEATQGPGEEK